MVFAKKKTSKKQWKLKVFYLSFIKKLINLQFFMFFNVIFAKTMLFTSQNKVFHENDVFFFFLETFMGWGGSLPSGQGRLATGNSQPVSIPGGPDKQQSMLTRKLAQQQSRATMRHAVGVQSPPSQNAHATTNCYDIYIYIYIYIYENISGYIIIYGIVHNFTFFLISSNA